MVKQDCIKSVYSSLDKLEKLRNSHILITGGTGFIGSWLSEMLTVLNEEYGFNVKIYLLGRNPPQTNSLKSNANIIFIKSDIRNLKLIPSEINFIIHAAGSPDSAEHISYPSKTLDTFYIGTKNILDLGSRLPNLVKIVHLSSNKVYGDNFENALIAESNNRTSTLKVNDVYAEAKRVSESLCRAFISEANLPIVITRPFAFVGPFQSLEKPWALNNFIRDAILGGPIRILGNQQTTKSYLYGSDVAAYLLNLLVLGKVGEVYNLGSQEFISLIDLAQKIKEIIGNSIDIKIKSSKDEYQTTLFDVPECSKIIQETGNLPAFSFEESLKKTIDWNSKR